MNAPKETGINSMQVITTKCGCNVIEHWKHEDVKLWGNCEI